MPHHPRPTLPMPHTVWAAGTISAVLLACLWLLPSTLNAQDPRPKAGRFEGIADDTLKVPIPDGWQPKHRSMSGMTVQMSRENPAATIVVTAVPQTGSLTDSPETRRSMAKSILKQMQQRLQANGVQVVRAPRIIPDKEFFIVIEDSFEEHGTATRRHYYRVLGVHLLMAAVTVFDATDEQIAMTFDQAGDVLWKVRNEKPRQPPGTMTAGKPTTFQKAGLRYTMPKGWFEQKTDSADGLIATYRLPVGFSKITVTAKPIAGANPVELAEGMVKADGQALENELTPDKPVAAEPAGVEVAQPAPGQGGNASTPSSTSASASSSAGSTQNGVTTRTQTTVASASIRTDRMGEGFAVESRAIRVGDKMISIGSAFAEREREKVSVAVDELAGSFQEFRLP